MEAYVRFGLALVVAMLGVYVIALLFPGIIGLVFCILWAVFVTWVALDGEDGSWN